jgi:hypothetical protein
MASLYLSGSGGDDGPRLLGSAVRSLTEQEGSLFAHGVRAVCRRPVVRVCEDPVNIETL